MLYLLVRKFRPEIVIETGIAPGISSAYVLLAMQ
jgi:predicted O-methyltransferase YrrM